MAELVFYNQNDKLSETDCRKIYSHYSFACLNLEQRYAQFFPQVVIEITESENNSPQHFNNKLSFIQKNRMMLAIDDFGSGNSNELRILSLQLDIIKIYMQMIQGIHNNEDKQKLVSNLVSFCRPKGIVLVAEGVDSGRVNRRWRRSKESYSLSLR